ncbi:hypothetical protein BH18ACI5_BH18ACI5_22110 [soil metagenome]
MGIWCADYTRRCKTGPDPVFGWREKPAQIEIRKSLTCKELPKAGSGPDLARSDQVPDDLPVRANELME